MDSRYLACTGRIRARESKLIDYPKFMRILESPSVEEVLKELGDTDYSEGLGEVRGAGDFELLINRQDRMLYKLFSDLTRDSDVTDLFFLANDFHNMKVAFKEKLSGSPSEKHAAANYMSPARYSPENIFRAVREDDYKSLENPLKEAARRLGGRLESTSSYQIVDIVLDEMYFSYALGVVKKHGNEFIRGVFNIQVDLVNIRTFIRLKEMNVEKKIFAGYLIGGGKIEYDFYLRAFEGSLDDFISSMRFKDYHDVVKQGLEYWQKEHDFSVLEKLFDDYIINFVKKAKYITFGIEPLIGYFFAKKMETINLRNIIVGKLNNVQDDAIKRRMRETYV